MNRLFILSLILLLPTVGLAQNLVPNPSFENFTHCPENSTDLITISEPWQSVSGIVNYYNECGINGYGIPESWGGGLCKKTGQACSGILTWYSLGFDGAYLGIELLQPLIEGKKYKVEFYISRMDSTWYATKNIGAYFSEDQPTQNPDILVTYQPQVKYTGTDYLTDKEGWTKIEGSFYADGGEQFMTIGNFDGFENSDTLFIGGGVPPPNLPHWWEISGYFIEDVSVVLDTTTGIDENGVTYFEAQLYPNPNDGTMYLEYLNLTEVARFELYDVTGRKINTYNLRGETGKLNITETGLSNGIYIYRIVNDVHKLKLGKVIISK